MNLISEIKIKKSLQIIYEDNKQINLNDLVEIIDQNSSVLNQLSIKKKRYCCNSFRKWTRVYNFIS